MNINTHMLIKDRKGEQMLLINWKYQKKIIILVLLGAFISCPTTGMCYAAEILSDNCVQESSKTVPIQKESIQESHYIAPDETAEFSISDEDANNITADSFSAQENLRIDTELQGENISAAVKDYTNFEEAELDIDNEKLALAIEKTGETTMTNNNDESVIKAGMSTKQKQQAIEKLMKKYGYRVRDIKDALKYIDWSKVTTDFAPTFYTSLKNGDLYFWDSSTYKYVFDEQVMKKMSVLIDEMKKSGYIVGEIKYVLKYIDWSKATTDFAPSFYIIVKNYYIADYITYHANSLYKYVFDEQVMKNVSTLIEEMRKYGYSKSNIKYALKYTDWEKRKITDFAPTFYTMLKDGDLKYFCDSNTYKYVFDEQVMKNVSTLIEEMRMYGYSVSEITDVLKYTDWEKRKTTDFASTFYTMLKDGDLKYFCDSNTYKYVFDEQVMKNASTLIKEMRMYGYSVSEITDVLKYTDWEKRKTTDFVPSFYTIVKNGYLVYLNNCSTNFLYEYVFDEQMMKNLFVLIDEMKKSGYDKKDITDALSYINWKKVKNNFNQIINIVKLNYNSLIVLHYMNYDKPAATYEILKVMKNNSICSNEDNMRFIFENYSNEIYGAYEKIYNDEKITNKEENLKKEFKKNENAYKRQVSINKSKNLLDKTLNVFKTTVIYVTAPIWMTALALYMAIGSTMDEGL